jgi:hypothetical protein
MNQDRWFMRPTDRMKSRAQTLFIGILAGFLMISVLACPLWMVSHNECPMPSSEEGNSEQCPLVICQLGVPYLAVDAGISSPLLKELPSEAVTSPVPWASAGIRVLAQQDNGAPPGLQRPLFLQNRSLLI